MSNFRPPDRQTGFLLPPSVDEWLPERHLARFVVEVVEGLDLRAMSGSGRGSGSASCDPTILPGLPVYGYATGVFSSRKLERATHDAVAFRCIAGNGAPRPRHHRQLPPALPAADHGVVRGSAEAGA
jgi:transposase